MKLVDKNGNRSQIAEAHLEHVKTVWAGIVKQLKQRGASPQDIYAMQGMVVEGIAGVSDDLSNPSA